MEFTMTTRRRRSTRTLPVEKCSAKRRRMRRRAGRLDVRVPITTIAHPALRPAIAARAAFPVIGSAASARGVEALQKLYDALVLQNQELLRTHVEVEKAHARYADLFEFVPAGHLTVNKDGLIEDINMAGMKLLGRSRHAL